MCKRLLKGGGRNVEEWERMTENDLLFLRKMWWENGHREHAAGEKGSLWAKKHPMEKKDMQHLSEKKKRYLSDGGRYR